MAETEVLVGTRKGLFVLRGARGGPLEIAARCFEKEPVEYACFDPRSGTYLASVTHWPEEVAQYFPGSKFGPRIYLTGEQTCGLVQLCRSRRFVKRQVLENAVFKTEFDGAGQAHHHHQQVDAGAWDGSCE